MLDYIWFDDNSPVLEQLPSNFTSMAILLHPFVQMPLGWEKVRRKNNDEHIYPSNEEAFTLGKPVSWQKIMSYSGIDSYKNLALAMLTSNCALNKEFKREDLADKLNANFKSDLYFPTDDTTSVFLLDRLMDVLGSKGASKIYYKNPILDKSGILNIRDVNPLEISNLAFSELMVADENIDFAFMSLHDSFTTLLLAKDKDIDHIVQSMNCEAVICGSETFINWYI